MRPTDHDNERRKAARLEAAEWRVRHTDEGPINVIEAGQFIRWLARSPHHVREYLLLCRLDQHLRTLASMREPSNVTRVDWWRGSRLKPPASKRRRLSSRWRMAAAVALILSAPVILALGRLSGGVWQGVNASASTPPKAIPLGDGSTGLAEDSHTNWKEKFTEQRRQISLRAGGAVFDVERDFWRPFIVRAAMFEIAAVDAKFAVRLREDVEVQVYRGMVQVSLQGTKPGVAGVEVNEGETRHFPVEELRRFGMASCVSDRRDLIAGPTVSGSAAPHCLRGGWMAREVQPAPATRRRARAECGGGAPNLRQSRSIGGGLFFTPAECRAAANAIDPHGDRGLEVSR
jgi:ferric-dicitrate binding protein FerR (iron transport regulator)